jgi:predicted amidohydrolase
VGELVDVPGPVVDRLAAACRGPGKHLAIGVNERELGGPGTLYDALLLIGPKGLVWKHRKLMPTTGTLQSVTGPTRPPVG